MAKTGTEIGQSAILASDGVLYTLRFCAAGTEQARTVDVVAIGPTGTQAWATKVQGAVTLLEIFGTLVLVATAAGAPEIGESIDDAMRASRLVALSTASGSLQWTLDLDGHLVSLEAFSGGFHALLVRNEGTNAADGMHDRSNRATSRRLSVTTIDNAGKVLWPIDLT